MSWDGLLLAGFWISIQIVARAMPYQHAAGRGNSLYQLLSLHTLKASSLTSCSSGTSSIVISV